MGLESADFIDELVISNPLATDPKSQGDDHIRLVKKVLQQSFPNISGAVTKTDGELNAVVPFSVGQFLFELFDANTGGNASPTSVTGDWARIGDLVTMWVSNLNNYSTAGMITANTLHFTLPFPPVLGGAGSIIVSGMDFNGRSTVGAILQPGGSRARIRTHGSGQTDSAISVGEGAGGDIVGLTLTYLAQGV